MGAILYQPVSYFPALSLFLLFFGGTSLNSGLHACKAGALLLAMPSAHFFPCLSFDIHRVNNYLLLSYRILKSLLRTVWGIRRLLIKQIINSADTLHTVVPCWFVLVCVFDIFAVISMTFMWR
jgi:hypothetical protein